MTMEPECKRLELGCTGCSLNKGPLDESRREATHAERLRAGCIYLMEASEE